jgi:hypothetical protein
MAILKEMRNLILTNLFNGINQDLSFSVFRSKHVEIASNIRDLQLNNIDFNKRFIDRYSAGVYIKDTFHDVKSELWDSGLIDENGHNELIDYSFHFMKLFSAINTLIDSTIVTPKWDQAMKKIGSVHQKFFDGNWSQQQRYINYLNKVYNEQFVPRGITQVGDEFIDVQFSDPNSAYNQMINGWVEVNIFPDINNVKTWNIEIFYLLLAGLTRGAQQFLVWYQNNGMQMYGRDHNAYWWTRNADTIFNYNTFDVRILEQNQVLICNNLLRPIGVLSDFIYKQYDDNDINNMKGRYITATLPFGSVTREQLIKGGNWIISNNDLNSEPNRWMISEIEVDEMTGDITIHADSVSNIIFSAIKNLRNETHPAPSQFFDQIRELVNIDANGHDLWAPPDNDGNGSHYDIKKWIDYLHELTEDNNGSKHERYVPRVMVDIINNPNDPNNGWIRDTLRIFQTSDNGTLSPKLVPFIFDESDIQEYKTSVKTNDLYSGYRELEANDDLSGFIQYGFEMDNNASYGDWNGIIAAGAGRWCDTWEKAKDQDNDCVGGYKNEFKNCPSKIQPSQMYKRNAFFISPFFAQDQLSFKPLTNNNAGSYNLLAEVKYGTSSPPDRSDCGKERTFMDKTVYDGRRSYYDAAKKRFDDKNYQKTPENYTVTLSITNYVKVMSKTDVNVGDTVLINFKDKILMTTIDKTEKDSDKLMDCKIEINTDYQPFLNSTGFYNSSLNNYEIDLESIFGVG